MACPPSPRQGGGGGRGRLSYTCSSCVHRLQSPACHRPRAGHQSRMGSQCQHHFRPCHRRQGRSLLCYAPSSLNSLPLSCHNHHLHPSPSCVKVGSRRRKARNKRSSKRRHLSLLTPSDLPLPTTLPPLPPIPVPLEEPRCEPLTALHRLFVIPHVADATDRGPPIKTHLFVYMSVTACARCSSTLLPTGSTSISLRSSTSSMYVACLPHYRHRIGALSLSTHAPHRTSARIFVMVCCSSTCSKSSQARSSA